MGGSRRGEAEDDFDEGEWDDNSAEDEAGDGERGDNSAEDDPDDSDRDDGSAEDDPDDGDAGTLIDDLDLTGDGPKVRRDGRAPAAGGTRAGASRGHEPPPIGRAGLRYKDYWEEEKEKDRAFAADKSRSKRPAFTYGGVTDARAKRAGRVADEDDYEDLYGDSNDATPPDPKLWLSGSRMTQTEACLRVGLFLVSGGFVAGDVRIALRGRETARPKEERFPVAAFLKDRGCRADGSASGWRGRYVVDGAEHGLMVSATREGADVEGPVSADSRVLVEVSGGTLVAGRSPFESNVLLKAIGKAMCFRGVGHGDVVAVVVPRSERFRKLVAAHARAPLIEWAGLYLCTVDRGGGVDGLPFVPKPGRRVRKKEKEI